MVCVFMRYEDGVEFGRIDAHLRKPLHDLAATQSGINQDLCFFGRDQDRVAGRAAAEN